MDSSCESEGMPCDDKTRFAEPITVNVEVDVPKEIEEKARMRVDPPERTLEDCLFDYIFFDVDWNFETD